MKRNLFILALAVCSFGVLRGQTTSDSLAIVSAQWEIVSPQKGIVHKRTAISQLYQGPQSINLIEIDPREGMKIGVAVSKEMKKTSQIASEHNAIAAINGSYFDMKRGNSVCFLKVGRAVIDTTTINEFKQRVTGAICEQKGKMKLQPWSRLIEKKYKNKTSTVLASGPLFLVDGKVSDWSQCETGFIQTQHPRSAICVTKEGKIWLITVDGRSKEHATGVNIPEFAHLIRILGGKDALNLDGGGSTTLWLSGASNDGVVNYPCDNYKFDHAGERKVPNIIYVYK